MMSSPSQASKARQKVKGKRQKVKGKSEEALSASLPFAFCLELDAQDFLLFGSRQLVNLADVSIGELLHFVEPCALAVFGDGFVLQELLQAVVGVAANIAYGRAMLFGDLVHLLGQLLAALFRQRWNRNAHELAV